jgi:hypothetical protein
MVFDRKSTGVGTVCHHTIQELPTGEQIFLAVDGIRIFNGATAPRIDAPVNDEIREQMNPQYFSKCWSVLRPDLDEYWVAVAIGSQTEPDTIYKYNWFTRQVYKDERLNISAINTYIDSNAVTIDELVGTIDSQTWRLDSVYMNSLNSRLILGGSGGVTSREDISVSNDIGIAIDGYLETKDFTALDYGIQEYGTLMRWKGIELWFKGDSVDFAYSTDSGRSWISAETIELDSNYTGDDAPLWAWFDVVSSQIRFRWRNNTAGEGFTVKKYAIHAVKRGKRK